MILPIEYKDSVRGFDYYIKKTLGSKISIGLILLSMNFGAQYHQTINKITDYVLNSNLALEQNYFPDPRELSIKYEKNSVGKREVYITYSPANVKNGIYTDLLPENKKILDGLDCRLSNKNDFNFSKEEKKELVDGLYNLYNKYKK
jgi:hypothetical protein